MRYFVSISFNGASYSGWQIQSNATSVQGTLERALSLAAGEPISVVGAGRTDAGVHAINYFAHFDISESCPKSPEALLYKINAILPSDICAHAIFPVEEEAHARFDATSRTYEYFLHTTKDPFAHFSYYCKYPLNVEAMNKAAEAFLGTQDFSSLEKVGGDNKTSICTVTEAFWSFKDPNHLVFRVSANRFLRNMVRAMVGTLLEVGRGRKEIQWVSELLKERDRCKAGQSVPGHALFLTKIEYPYIENK